MSHLRFNLEEYVHDRTVYVTFTNAGYVHYTSNLYHSCQIAKVPWKLVVIALDNNAYESLAELGIPSIYCNVSEMGLGQAAKEYCDYCHPDFKMLCYYKLDIIRQLLNECKTTGCTDHVVYLDGDIWVQRDFSLELKKYKHDKSGNDITFQCDEGTTNSCIKPCRWICAGMMMLSVCGNYDTLIKLLEYRRDPIWQGYKHDQDYMFYALPKSGVSYDTFDRRVFPNGYHAKHNAIPPEYALIHYNWLIGDEKQKHMQANGHWHLVVANRPQND